MSIGALKAAIAVGSVVIVGLATASADPASATSSAAARVAHLCPTASAGRAQCMAVAVATPGGVTAADVGPDPSAFSPTDVQKVYGLAGLRSGGRTVAIVDAFAYPKLESELATYRAHYALPPCTTANGCLKVIGQDGGAPPTQRDDGWDGEQALDLDAVSATCPDCKIVMVQADVNSGPDLARSVVTASKQPGVVAISNSYGGGGVANQPSYRHPGIAVVASTGDSGFQTRGTYPANDTYVVSVGGTSVTRSGSTYTESAWDGAGSGCGVKGNKRPAWQPQSVTTCATRASADVSAAADPAHGGLAVYYDGAWNQFGGTSEAAPIISAVFALSGNTTGYPGRRLWQQANARTLNDVTSGANGTCGAPLCTAGTGWDGPTGLGTPRGVGAF